MTAAPDLERIKARIRQLREMTAARGCTEAEARAAARKVAELMAAYKLTDQDIDMGVADAPHRTRRTTIRDRLWPRVARLTNCAFLFLKGADGPVVARFFGREPYPEIAAYLKDVLDRSIDFEVRAFKRSAFYRRRRKTATRRKAVRDFTQAMVWRLLIMLEDMLAAQADPHLAQEAKGYRDLVSGDVTEHQIPLAGKRYSEADSLGWRAGGRVQLNPGMAGDRAVARLGLTKR